VPLVFGDIPVRLAVKIKVRIQEEISVETSSLLDHDISKSFRLQSAMTCGVKKGEELWER